MFLYPVKKLLYPTWISTYTRGRDLNNIDIFLKIEEITNQLTSRLHGKSFDRKNINYRSVEYLIRQEVREIFSPTLVWKKHYDYNGHILSDDRLSHVISERSKAIRDSFLNAQRDISQIIGGNCRNEDVHLTPLDGDSHRNAERPFFVEINDRKYVYKHADPKIIQALYNTISYMEQELAVGLHTPEILSLNDEWYLRPFLEAGGTYDEAEIKNFMFCLGVITYVSYILRCTDLHLENVICTNGIPLIIDPECSFYDVIEESGTGQLFTTGLVGRAPHLTTICGGGELTKITTSLQESGRLNYYSSSHLDDNRIKNISGDIAHPKDYIEIILEGFKKSHAVFRRNKKRISQDISDILGKDAKIRHLLRKTRQYKIGIDIANLPFTTEAAEAERQELIFNTICMNGAFFEDISITARQSELSSINNRDIPYFWYTTGSNIVNDQNGQVYVLKKNKTTIDSIQDMTFFRHDSEQEISARAVPL